MFVSALASFCFTELRYSAALIFVVGVIDTIFEPFLNRSKSSKKASISLKTSNGREPEKVKNPRGFSVPVKRITLVIGPLRLPPRMRSSIPPSLEKSRVTFAACSLPRRSRAAINGFLPSTGSAGI